MPWCIFSILILIASAVRAVGPQTILYTTQPNAYFDGHAGGGYPSYSEWEP
jgi:hypothetical protein